MFKKLFILPAVFLCFCNALANPSPLGIELNKDTLEKVTKTYKVIRTSQNIIEGYYNNFLDTKDIDINSISEADVVSNSDKVVEAVILKLRKSQFDEIYKALSGKYELLESNTPFVGNKFVKLQDGDCFVIIDAPHMSFEMDVIYVSKVLYNKNLERIKREKKEEEKKNESML